MRGKLALFEPVCRIELPRGEVAAGVFVDEVLERHELGADGRRDEFSRDADEVGADLGAGQAQVFLAVVRLLHERQIGHVVVEKRLSASRGAVAVVGMALDACEFASR